MSIHRLLNESRLQQRWLDGELSNFDYLMALNTLAGRSYNDLCQVRMLSFCGWWVIVLIVLCLPIIYVIYQYPVFPWVISQYTETTIDLKDPRTFRDLSKPMGALNEERLAQFLDRFESFRESDMPPFM